MFTGERIAHESPIGHAAGIGAFPDYREGNIFNELTVLQMMKQDLRRDDPGGL